MKIIGKGTEKIFHTEWNKCRSGFSYQQEDTYTTTGDKAAWAGCPASQKPAWAALIEKKDFDI